MKAKVTVDDPDDVIITEIDARDRRAFERAGRKEIGISPVSALQDVVKASPEMYLTWLAWHSLKRAARLNDKVDFITFERRVVLIEAEGSDEDTGGLPDPTQTQRSGG